MALIEFKNLPDTDTPINEENLNNNFNELQGKINNIFTLLWSNATTNIAGGAEITLSSDDYDALLVFFRPNGAYTPTKGEFWFKGVDWRLYSHDSSNHNFYRAFTRNSATSFTAGYTYMDGVEDTGDNGKRRNVPMYIYGVKF